MNVIIMALLASLLPFWRDAMYPGRGRNTWEYLADAHSEEYKESHIPVDEAVTSARAAYLSRGLRRD